MPHSDPAAAGEDEVLTEYGDGVLLLRFNRPAQLNAWTRTMQARYFDLLEAAEQDPDVRAIVVTGSGRGFCAGTDFAALAEGGISDPDDRPLSLPIGLRKPIISAINGPVAGIGLVTALFTDVRFAAEEASFTTAFSRNGLIAEHGIAWLLPKLVGVSTALDLLLSARTLPGVEAEQLGLVDRALPADQVLDAAWGYAHSLATDCSPESMAEIKQQVYTGLDSGLEVATAEAAERMMFALHRRSSPNDRPD
ncbi:enoyl-CoA hydratase-related protein [Parasphingorhabdus pacifica]